LKAWNVQPVNGMTGDEFTSVVHGMLLDLRTAVSSRRDWRRDPAGRRRSRRRSRGALERHFPDSHVVAFPHLGHSWSGVGGCIDPVVTDFVERGTTKGLDTTGSDGVVVVPPFPLTS